MPQSAIYIQILDLIPCSWRSVREIQLACADLDPVQPVMRTVHREMNLPRDRIPADGLTGHASHYDHILVSLYGTNGLLGILVIIPGEEHHQSPLTDLT